MMELQQWASEALEMIQLAERLSDGIDRLASIPAGGTPEERLSAMGELWAAFGVNRPNLAAIDDRAGRLAAMVKVEADPARYAFRRMLTRIHDERARLIESGAHDPKWPCLRRADFGSYGCLTVGGEMDLIFGPVDRLPANHWARDLLPADDLFQLGGRGCLLLGKMEQAFYEAATVVSLTKDRRRQQKAKEEAEREQETCRERERQAAREKDPLYHTAKLEEELAGVRKRLAEMEAREPKKSTAKR